MFEIKYASDCDREFWYTLDSHLSAEEFEMKIRDRRGYIISEEGKRAGIMRYNLFWDSIPFVTLIYIAEERRGRGLGKKTMLHWENEMSHLGYKMIMTSTQADEQAQHFYRKLGYRDSGCLILDTPPFSQPAEIFMVKYI